MRLQISTRKAVLLTGVMICLGGWIFYQSRPKFYGKVVDEDDNPIPGTKISAQVLPWWHYAMGNGSGLKIREATSDAYGRFVIRGGGAATLSIGQISKPGYLLVPCVTSFSCDGSQGLLNASAPVTFVMSKGNSRPKILKLCNRRFAVDWGKEQILPVGIEGVEVILKSNRVRNPEQRRGFPWSVDLRTTGLELTPIAADAPPLAPLTEYVSNFTINSGDSAEDWRAWFKQDFAFRTLKGEYGHLQLEISCIDEDAWSGNIQAELNESGGRVLR